MTVGEVYQHFKVPPNVQVHMFSTAQVVELLRENWTGPEVDWEVALKAVLVHDIANIVKFKRPFLDPQLELKGDYWLKVQDEMVAKYGEKASKATLMMVRELDLPISEKIAYILERMSEVISSKKEVELPIESRILEFADMVVTPKGIENYQVRIDDLTKRYNKVDPDWDRFLRENAELIQGFTSIDVFGDLGEMVDKMESGTKAKNFLSLEI